MVTKEFVSIFISWVLIGLFACVPSGDEPSAACALNDTHTHMARHLCRANTHQLFETKSLSSHLFLEQH